MAVCADVMTTPRHLLVQRPLTATVSAMRAREPAHQFVVRHVCRDLTSARRDAPEPDSTAAWSRYEIYLDLGRKTGRQEVIALPR